MNLCKSGSYITDKNIQRGGVWERVSTDLLVCKIYAILNSTCSQSVADGRRDHLFTVVVINQSNLNDRKRDKSERGIFIYSPSS